MFRVGDKVVSKKLVHFYAQRDLIPNPDRVVLQISQINVFLSQDLEEFNRFYPTHRTKSYVIANYPRLMSFIWPIDDLILAEKQKTKRFMD